jgi:hypothetical protein
LNIVPESKKEKKNRTGSKMTMPDFGIYHDLAHYLLSNNVRPEMCMDSLFNSILGYCGTIVIHNDVFDDMERYKDMYTDGTHLGSVATNSCPRSKVPCILGKRCSHIRLAGMYS